MENLVTKGPETELELCESTISHRIVNVEFPASSWSQFEEGISSISIRMSSRLKVQNDLATLFLDSFGLNAGDLLRSVLVDRTRGILLMDLSTHSSDPLVWSKFLVAMGAILGKISIKPNRLEGFEPGLLVDPGRGILPSHVKSPYEEDRLHNDGSRLNPNFDDFVAILMSQKDHCHGGTSKLLHLDDWAELPALADHPLAETPFSYVMHKRQDGPVERSLAIDGKSDELSIMQRSLFYTAASGVCSRVSPGYMRPADSKMLEYVEAVQRALLQPVGIVDIDLSPGQMWVVNNAFVLHGRRAIDPHPELARVIQRVKGFFVQPQLPDDHL